jgi:hypothetical protein
MAAVLALIMVPLLASLCFMAGVTRADGSAISAVAMASFFSLGAFVLFGILRFVRKLEET